MPECRGNSTGGPLTFVLGGARSGKSAYAEGVVAASGLAPVYLATCEPFDDELRARVAQHRARRGPEWRTVDAPLELPAAIEREGAPGRVLLVDCLTLWLGNLMHHERELDAAFEALSASLAATRAPTVLVSNETSLGLVPENPLARRFRDAAGTLNQRIAADASRVVMVVAGLPMSLKGGLP